MQYSAGSSGRVSSSTPSSRSVCNVQFVVTRGRRAITGHCGIKYKIFHRESERPRFAGQIQETNDSWPFVWLYLQRPCSISNTNILLLFCREKNTCPAASISSRDRDREEEGIIGIDLDGMEERQSLSLSLGADASEEAIYLGYLLGSILLHLL